MWILKSVDSIVEATVQTFASAGMNEGTRAGIPTAGIKKMKYADSGTVPSLPTPRLT